MEENLRTTKAPKYRVYTKVHKDNILPGTKIVDTKWVYVIKQKPDGGIEKFTARKVSPGGPKARCLYKGH